MRYHLLMMIAFVCAAVSSAVAAVADADAADAVGRASLATAIANNATKKYLKAQATAVAIQISIDDATARSAATAARLAETQVALDKEAFKVDVAQRKVAAAHAIASETAALHASTIEAANADVAYNSATSQRIKAAEKASSAESAGATPPSGSNTSSASKSSATMTVEQADAAEQAAHHNAKRLHREVKEHSTSLSKATATLESLNAAGAKETSAAPKNTKAANAPPVAVNYEESSVKKEAGQLDEMASAVEEAAALNRSNSSDAKAQATLREFTKSVEEGKTTMQTTFAEDSASASAAANEQAVETSNLKETARNDEAMSTLPSAGSAASGSGFSSAAAGSAASGSGFSSAAAGFSSSGSGSSFAASDAAGSGATAASGSTASGSGSDSNTLQGVVNQNRHLPSFMELMGITSNEVCNRSAVQVAACDAAEAEAAISKTKLARSKQTLDRYMARSESALDLAAQTVNRVSMLKVAYENTREVALNQYKKKMVVVELKKAVKTASISVDKAQEEAARATKRCHEMDAAADASGAENKTVYAKLRLIQMEAAEKRSIANAAVDAKKAGQGDHTKEPLASAKAAEDQAKKAANVALIQNDETKMAKFAAARACRNASMQGDLIDTAVAKLEEAQESLQLAQDTAFPTMEYQTAKATCERAQNASDETNAAAIVAEQDVITLTTKVNATMTVVAAAKANVTKLSKMLSDAKGVAELAEDEDDKASLMERAADISQQLESAKATWESYKRKASQDKTQLADAKQRLEKMEKIAPVYAKAAESACTRLVPLQQTHERIETEKIYIKNKEAMANLKLAKKDYAAGDKEVKSACGQYNATVAALKALKEQVKEAKANATKANEIAAAMKEKVASAEKVGDKVLIEEAVINSNKAESAASQTFDIAANLSETRDALDAEEPVLKERCDGAIKAMKEFDAALSAAKRGIGYVKPVDTLMVSAKANVAHKEKALNASKIRASAVCSEASSLAATVKAVKKTVNTSEQAFSAAVEADNRVDQSDEDAVAKAADAVQQANETLAAAKSKLLNESKWLVEYDRRCTIANKDLRAILKEYEMAVGVVQSLDQKFKSDTDALFVALNKVENEAKATAEATKLAIDDVIAANNSVATAETDLADAIAAANSNFSPTAQADVELMKVQVDHEKAKLREADQKKVDAVEKATTASEKLDSTKKMVEEATKPIARSKVAEDEAAKAKEAAAQALTMCTRSKQSWEHAKVRAGSINMTLEEARKKKTHTAEGMTTLETQARRAAYNVTMMEAGKTTECTVSDRLQKEATERQAYADSLRGSDSMTPWELLEHKYTAVAAKLAKDMNAESATAAAAASSAEKAVAAAQAALDYMATQKEAADFAVEAGGDWVTTELKQPKTDYEHLNSAKERLESNKDWLRVISTNTKLLTGVLNSRKQTLDSIMADLASLKQILDGDKLFMNDALRAARSKLDKASASVKVVFTKKEEAEAMQKTAMVEHEELATTVEDQRAVATACSAKSLVLQADCRNALKAAAAQVKHADPSAGGFTTDMADAELQAALATLASLERNASAFTNQSDALTVTIEALRKNLTKAKAKRDNLKSDSTRLKGLGTRARNEALDVLHDTCVATFYDQLDFKGESYEFTTQLANPSNIASVADSGVAKSTCSGDRYCKHQVGQSSYCNVDSGLCHGSGTVTCDCSHDGDYKDMHFASVSVTPGCAAKVYTKRSFKGSPIEVSGNTSELVLASPVESLIVYSNNVSLTRAAGVLL